MVNICLVLSSLAFIDLMVITALGIEESALGFIISNGQLTLENLRIARGELCADFLLALLTVCFNPLYFLLVICLRFCHSGVLLGIHSLFNRLGSRIYVAYSFFCKRIYLCLLCSRNALCLLQISFPCLNFPLTISGFHQLVLLQCSNLDLKIGNTCLTIFSEVSETLGIFLYFPIFLYCPDFNIVLHHTLLIDTWPKASEALPDSFPWYSRFPQACDWT